MRPSASDLLNDAEVLLAALGKSLPGLQTSAKAVGDKHPELFPEEVALPSPKAVEKRRQEFHAGRIAARDCLNALGLPNTPIGRHPNRAPHWPEGVIGSLSHTNAVAIAAARVSGPSMGTDLEYNEPLEADLANVISTDEERNAMRTVFPTAPSVARIIFSAKESVYKAISLQVGRVVGFDEISITPAAHSGSFEAVAKTDLNGQATPSRIVATGGIFLSLHHILTYAENRLNS